MCVYMCVCVRARASMRAYVRACARVYVVRIYVRGELLSPAAVAEITTLLTYCHDDNQVCMLGFVCRRISRAAFTKKSPWVSVRWDACTPHPSSPASSRRPSSVFSARRVRGDGSDIPSVKGDLERRRKLLWTHRECALISICVLRVSFFFQWLCNRSAFLLRTWASEGGLYRRRTEIEKKIAL